MGMAGDMSVGKNQTQNLMFLMAFLFLVQLLLHWLALTVCKLVMAIVVHVMIIQVLMT